MSAPGRCVGLANDDVGVHLRLAIFQRDIAGERQHFDLLLKRDPFVVLALTLEEAERDVAEGANAGEARRCHVLLLGEGQQLRDDFISLVEDEDVPSLSVTEPLRLQD
jgi:hypothetical protein